jgi:hypothetical protein
MNMNSKKIVSGIVLLATLFSTNIVSANNTQTNNSMSIYTSEYNTICKEILTEQASTWRNQVSAKLKRQIDNIWPAFQKQHGDKKLIEVNNKIITILANRNRNNVLSNTYLYLLVKLEEAIVDKTLITPQYIQRTCALSLIPIDVNSQPVVNNNSPYTGYKIPEFNVNWVNPIFDKKISVEQFMTLTNAEAIIRSGTWDHERSIRDTKESLERNRAIPDHLKAFHWFPKWAMPESIILAIKDYPQMLKDLSITEEKRLIELAGSDGEIITLKVERAYVEYDAMHESDPRKIAPLVNRRMQLDREIRELEFQEMELIRKRWDLKNMCIDRTDKWYHFFDRTTREQLPTMFLFDKSPNYKLYEKNTAPGAIISFFVNESRQMAFQWFPMYCDYFLLYPELNTKESDIKKMSIQQLENAMRTHSFTPTEENTRGIKLFMWDTSLDTPLKQMQYVHNTMQEMKQHLFLTELRRKQWKTNYTDIYSWIELKTENRNIW